MSRCTGLKRDLRLNKYTTYNNYYFLNFNSYIGVNGDSYDRFLLRMYEMVESLNIVNQNLVKFKPKDVKYLHSLNSSIINESNNMESIIKHFKF